MTQRSITGEIESEGCGDWTEHEDWESATSWAREMPAEQRQAARLLGRAIDPERIDKMMDLPSGQVEKWWDESEPFKNAASASFWSCRERESRPDPAKALTTKQLTAADLYFRQGRSQREVAKRTGVTDRTIRNWLQDPVFVDHGESIRRELTESRARELKERDQLTLARYRSQVEKAQDLVDEALEEKDRRVALEILRPYLRRVP